MASKRKKASQWLVLIPAAAIIAAGGYWNIGGSSGPQLARLDPEHRVDFFSANSRTVQFNTQGQLQYILEAELIEHIEQTDISLLHKPYLQLYRARPQPWLISGEHGELSPGGEVLDLQENVRVERTDELQRPFLLTTSQLYYVFAQDLAHTGKDVQIDTEQGITTATGMRAYMEQGAVELLSNARGRYEFH